MSHRVSRLKPDRLIERCDRLIKKFKTYKNASERLVRHRKLRVDGYCFLGDIHRLIVQLSDAEEVTLQVVSNAQCRQRTRVARIGLGCPLEEVDCPIKRVAAARSKIHHPA